MKILSAVLALGLVTLVACSSDNTTSSSGGSGNGSSSGTGSSSGNSTSSSSGSQSTQKFTCSLNGACYECPSSQAVFDCAKPSIGPTEAGCTSAADSVCD